MIQQAIVNLNGLRFNAFSEGTPQADAVILLHGFPQFADAWTNTMHALLRREPCQKDRWEEQLSWRRYRVPQGRLNLAQDVVLGRDSRDDKSRRDDWKFCISNSPQKRHQALCHAINL